LGISICLIQANAAYHVMEEIAELRNAERHTGTKCRIARLWLYFVVFVTDGSEWLEVGINVHNVRALQINQSWGNVVAALARAHVHDVLNALVEQLSGQNHTISLTVVDEKLEDGSRRHFMLSLYTG